MASPAEVVEEVGRRLGLQGAAAGPIVYGERENYLVQVESEVRGSVQSVVETIRYGGPPERRRVVLGALRDAAEVKSAGISPERLRASGGTLVYIHRPPAAGSTAESIAREVEVLLGAMKRLAAPLPRLCRECGDRPGEVALVCGVVDRLCSVCRDVEQAGQGAAAADRPEDAWVIDAWKRRYLLKALVFFLFFFSILPALFVAVIANSMLVFVIILAGLVWALLGWVMPRLGCPNCGEDPSTLLQWTGRGALLNPEFCFRCGVRLRAAKPQPRAQPGREFRLDDARAVVLFRRRRVARASTVVVFLVTLIPLLLVSEGAVIWRQWFEYIPVVYAGFLVGSFLVWLWSLFCPNCRGLVYSSVTGKLTPERCPACGVLLT
ncbi:MAG: hypothetical protein HY727_09290 [Candidatus Rokubacteria bacterium]|nr:hypothetical protein [Candidatus Rokubacteria bacterium]